MTTNSRAEFEPPDSDESCSLAPSGPSACSDSVLDQLLSEAKWPEPDTEAISRLESIVTTALAESMQNVAPAELKRAGLRRRTGLRSLTLATALAAGLLFAFLAGRWTSPDVVDGVAATKIVEQPSDSGQTPPNAVETSPTQPAATNDPSPSNSMAAVDLQNPKHPTESNPSETLVPKADPLTEKRRRLTQRERMQQQLDAVLLCLEEDGRVDASCCESLMPRRAEFAFLLGEMIRNTTGQRQTAAVTALGFIGTDGSVPMLLQSSATGDLRTAAIEAAKRCSSEQMLAALVLQKGDQSLRAEFLVELAHRTTPQAATAWLHLMRSPESRELCLQTVDELSPALIDVLFAELDAPLIDDRMAAILSLGRRADEPTLKRVTRLCQQYHWRWEPVAILMWNGSESAMKTLTDLQKIAERYAVLQTASVQLESFGGRYSKVRTGNDAP